MIKEFTSILDKLKTNNKVEFITFPKCPKENQSYCLAVNGHCETGNNKQCVQKCSLFFNNSLYNFEVLYCYKKDTRLGYVNTESLMYRNFIKTGLVK